MEMNFKLLVDTSTELVDATLYRHIIGSLMYMTNTMPYICFVVNTLSQYLVEPRCVHLVATKHVMRYLKGWMLQPFPIQEWKWEVVIVYFITKLPRTMKQHDSIMVVVDKLTKETHFILVKTTHKTQNISKIYMKEVARIHGVPKKIVSDRDPKFTSIFWKGFFKGFGTNVNLSTMYHPESYGKT
jgi:hypothetical protein